MKRFFTLLLLSFSVHFVSAQIATYAGSGGLSTAIVGVPNETVSILQASGFGANTPCSSGGLSGMTVSTTWSTYSTAGPRVFFKITPNSGYVLNVTGITAGIRRSGTGPVNTRFAYSLDNGSTWIDDGVNHAASGGGCGTTLVSSWGGGALPTGISSTVNGIIVALFPFAPGGSTGTYQVNSIVVNGNVTGGCSTPTVYSVTGGGSYCSGGSGVAVGLSNSQVGVTYQLYNGATTVGAPVSGTGSSLSFGSITAAGTYTVLATSTPGCTSNMSGSAVISINPSPSAISGTLAVCQTESTTLGNSVAGGTWTSGASSIATVGASSGVVTGIAPGTSVMSYSTATCGPVTVVVTVNPLAPITGTLELCQGTIGTLSNLNSGGTWASGSPSIVSVGASSGVVSGILAGTSAIAYTLPTGCSSTEIVTVNPAVSAISGSGSICVGSALSLATTSTGGTWSSSSGSIASVSPAGIVTGNSAGVVSISYTLSTGCYATANVTVLPLPASITGSAFVCFGSSTTLSSTTSGGTWVSSDPSVAPVTAAGVVSGSSLGTSLVSYTLSTGCATSTIVTVSPLPSSITGPSITCIGLSVALTSTTVGGSWQSSLPAVASVDIATGAVTGVSSGTATISYVFGTGCSVTYSVSVNTPPAPILGATAICVGDIATMTDAVPGGTWASAAAAQATIGAASGIMTGISAGTTIISYLIPGCNPGTLNVVVNPLPAVIGGITNVCVGSVTILTNASPGGTWTSSNTLASVVGGVVLGLSPGSSTIISYTLPTGCVTTAAVIVDSLPAFIIGLDSVCQGSSVTLSNSTGGGIWTSSDGTVASAIAATGIVTGLIPGMVSISYSLVSGCRRVVPFKVIEPLPAGVTITVSPDTATICAGTPVTFTAHGVNGGAPTFEWKKFGFTQDTGISFTYTPIHGDFISVDMTVHGICAAPNPAHSFIYMNIYPIPAPSVTIMTFSDTVLHYLGQTVTFFSDVTFGGSITTYQWYRNRMPVAGATNSSYKVELYTPDTFYCIVGGNAPCGPVVSTPSNSVIISSTLGVTTSNGISNDLQLFPNPNAGNFRLTGHVNGNEPVVADIVNMLGQQVFQINSMPVSGELNMIISPIEALANGSYVLRVHSSSGQQQFHFVVSH